jgi:hypothetical protein
MKVLAAFPDSARDAAEATLGGTSRSSSLAK